jgi:hypothetical protein
MPERDREAGSSHGLVEGAERGGAVTSFTGRFRPGAALESAP